MKHISLLLCSTLLICTPFFAEDAKPQPAPTPDIANTYTYTYNEIGDQFIKLGINVDIPILPDLDHLKTGGAGDLGYQRFIFNNICVGGNISFAYSATIGENVFYYVPVMGNFTYQFSSGKFEFPVSINIGGAFENYNDIFYFGLVVKPEFGAYWRYSSDWSLGLHAGLFILPQWYDDSEDNYTGIISDIGFSVRYHF